MGEIEKHDCVTELGTLDVHGRVVLSFAIPFALQQLYETSSADDSAPHKLTYQEQTEGTQQLAQLVLARVRQSLDDSSLEALSEDIDTAYSQPGLGTLLAPFLWDYGYKMGHGDPKRSLAHIACAACQLSTALTTGAWAWHEQQKAGTLDT